MQLKIARILRLLSGNLNSDKMHFADNDDDDERRQVSSGYRFT